LREGGFSSNEVETAISICGYDEVQLGVYLTSTLIDFDAPETETEDESEQIWNEELESLTAIYGEDKVAVKQDIAEISLNPEGINQGLLALKV
ncbi:hypothetical protein WICPIJ_003917, partial [Wickerhamomyces pijperi]